MNFIAGHHKDAFAARGRRHRHPRRGEKIGRSVGARLTRPAHGRRKDNRHLELHKHGQRERALFERVRAMGNHNAGAGLGRGRGGGRYRCDVRERDVRAGFCQHIAPFDICKVREIRY